MLNNGKIKLPILNEHMIRPCYIYGEEFNECITPKGRFHQYFIYGEYLDCSQWQTDYENCLLWKNYRNKTAVEHLVNSENKRRNKRLEGHYKNNIWTKRDNPPKNWNMPLPAWMKAKNQSPCLQEKNCYIKKEIANDSNVIDSKICSIL